MNKKWQNVLMLSAILAVGSSGAFGRQKRTLVHPEDTGEALVNPGMGWVFHYYSNVPTNYGSKLLTTDTPEYFPGLSHIYLRIPWAQIALSLPGDDGHRRYTLGTLQVVSGQKQ
jgi:hypothetical protein